MSRAFDVVVIGGGLAGISASLKLLEKGFSVALVEKEEKLGGNSIKASSGINGVPTQYQPVPNTDSVEAFIADTLDSGKGLCNEKLVDILAKDSAAAVSWLTEHANVDLQKVTRLGGHSHARTHRGSGKLPPGFAIISALSTKLKAVSTAHIMTQARFVNFLKLNDAVTGVVVDDLANNKREQLLAKHIILATGGFLADSHSEASLLKEFRPDLLRYPLTNGKQTTGDGQRIAQSDLAANLVHMDQVQVHPTGFIQLKDLATITNHWKFLCGELIRGIGGILISSVTGQRFVNELDTRDNVTEAIVKHCGEDQVAVIIVSEEDYEKAAAHIGFYASQSLMFHGTVDDLVLKLLQVVGDQTASKAAFLDGLEDYDPEVSDKLGRLHFGHKIGQKFYFGFVTPVLHFAMGGIQTNELSQIKDSAGQTVQNVYAIGEVSAGVHGANRLAGSSLLECVVFGSRVADHIAQQS